MVQDKELHYRSKEEIRLFQEARLRETIAYVADRSAFYRRLFEEHQIDPASIRTLEDLKRLPLTSKEDLQLHGEEFVCVGKREIIDYVTTSGTLGDPVTFTSRRATWSAWPITRRARSAWQDARRRM